MEDANKYDWYKSNVFVRWLPHQTAILIFDAPQNLAARMPHILTQDFDLEVLRDPLWPYPHFLDDVVQLQDTGVWSFRSKIRSIEKSRLGAQAAPPNFSDLHDLGRHAIHIGETLKLVCNTIHSILRTHDTLLTPDTALNTGVAVCQPCQGVGDRLRFCENVLQGLTLRAESNHERLRNEIQLAFNVVAQMDARISLDVNRIMQRDSRAMRAIAGFTAALLPATFVAALFSMSFFENESDAGWTWSPKIWIYFVTAVPLTVLTMGVWYYWRRLTAVLSSLKRRQDDGARLERDVYALRRL